MNSLPMRLEKIIPYNEHLFFRLGMITHSIMPSGRFLHHVRWEFLDGRERVKITLEWILPTEFSIQFLPKWADRKRY